MSNANNSRRVFVGRLENFFRRVVDKILCIGKLKALRAGAPGDGGGLFRYILQALSIGLMITPKDIARIPASGPVVIVANHPHGLLDGIVAGTVLSFVRQDIKFLATSALAGISQLQDSLILVDISEEEGAPERNLKAMRTAYRHLKNGGALVIFPGRQVSHFRLSEMKITDAPWSPTIGTLIRLAKAPVLPVFFDGHNSLSFQVAGALHPRLRTMLLPRELIKKRSSTIEMRIGDIIPWQHLKDIGGDETRIRFARLACYAMANRPPSSDLINSLTVQTTRHFLRAKTMEPLPADDLEREIRGLPAARLLLKDRNREVYIAPAAEIPLVLTEIGIQRERTFREVDEGTGRAYDLDDYDTRYLHLFQWDSDARAIVGGYRLGLAPEITRDYGIDGLYTNNFFEYHPELFRHWGPSIELGRAFICPKYQRDLRSLKNLWLGIGEFISRNPKYRTLFGPLSISQAYSVTSKTLIVSYALKHLSDPVLARYIHARYPFTTQNLRGIHLKEFSELVRNLDDLSSVISSIEPDGKGLPILFRQYSRFNFRVLDFNVNPIFSSTTDGLMYVDMRTLTPKGIKMLMSETAYRNYLDHHQVETLDLSLKP